jgi:hypothetical protein
VDEFCCEVPGCSMPGTICPACDQCLCWQHRQRSSCEICHKLLSEASFEHRLGRLLSIGLSVLLCGILFLLLPRDDDGTILQLAILLLVVGSLLMWLGWLAHV